MRRLLLLLAIAVSLGTSWTASAVPIPLYGGTADGTLRFFDFQRSEDYSFFVLLLRAEYELGVDFMPAVPLSFQQNQTPYTACVASSLSSYLQNIVGDCVTIADALVVPGTNLFTGRFNDDPSQLGDLQDACTPIVGGGPSVAMIARGTCSFTAKWESVEAAGWAGVLVENNVAGALGAIGSLASANEPTIPFFLITQAVADEIRTSSRGYFLDGSSDGGHYFPTIEMRVSWTPPTLEPQPVPEPGTLLLLSGGLVALGVLGFAGRRKLGLIRA